MLGIYNNAILYNQELLTPQNARIFHGQFAAFLNRSLDYIEDRGALHAERERLEKDRQRLIAGHEKVRTDHTIVFLMTPFDSEYHKVENALREVVEDRWEC